MQLLVSTVRRKSTVGSGGLPAAVAWTDPTELHALVAGSPVAICGTPVSAVPDTPPWPPMLGERCPSCDSLVAQFVS